MTYVLKDPDETVRLKARTMVRGHFGSYFYCAWHEQEGVPNLARI